MAAIALVAGLVGLGLLVGTLPANGAGKMAYGVSRARETHCAWTRGLNPGARARATLARMSVSQRVDLLGLKAGHKVENTTSWWRGLCFGALTMSDGPSGLAAGTRGQVALGSQLSVAATMSAQISYEYGVALGSEARAKKIGVIQGPGLDVGVYPGWGRNFENFGGEVGMAEWLGLAEVKGINKTGTISEPKHFGVYTSEVGRNNTNHIVSQATQENLYWAPFRVVALYSGALMCSVGEVNSVASCSNAKMYAALRSWGFRGLVRSDMGGARNETQAILAGTDLIKPYSSVAVYRGWKNPVIRRGVDRNDLVVLTAMFRRNDKKKYLSAAGISRIGAMEASRSLTLLENKGALPLRSGRGVLVVTAEMYSAGGGSSKVYQKRPASWRAAMEKALVGAKFVSVYSTGKRAKLVGERRIGAGWKVARVASRNLVGKVDLIVGADTAVRVMVGSRAAASYLSGTLSGIQYQHEALITVHKGESVNVIWKGNEHPRIRVINYTGLVKRAVRMARRATSVIVGVGELDTEGLDRTNLNLPGYQNYLIDQLARANRRVVVVVTSGGAITASWANKVNAVLEAWYPGAFMGKAIAGVISGKVDPSGRSPVVFPMSNTEIPRPYYVWPGSLKVDNLNRYGTSVGANYYLSRGLKVRWGFGYGLAYTSFSIKSVSAKWHKSSLVIKAVIQNTGKVSGRAVPEAYLRFPISSGVTGDAFVGASSAMISAGATRVIKFTVPRYMLTQWVSGKEKSFAGRYRLRVAQSFYGTGVSTLVTVPTGVGTRS